MVREISGVNINIALNNGIWLLSPDSATGKTRLGSLLRSLELNGDSICSFSYEDIQLGRHLEDILVPGKYDLIMLDRYDMYAPLGLAAMKSCATNTIILIDCKKSDMLDYDDVCFITMTESSIEVDL